jgi:parallel beta-helix repeat protein
MTTINVSSASQLTAALRSAGGGDVIKLAAGNYGDVTLSKMASSNITIQSADIAHAATFDTLLVKGSADLTFANINLAMTPTAATTTSSSGVMVDSSRNIVFNGGSFHGGNAISGVAQTATALDSTGNVIGLPTSRGFTIQNSTGVTVENADVSTFMRGIVITNSDKVTIQNNNIHDMRTTAIVGGGNDLVIAGNHLSSSHPWELGHSYGDHADYIALFTGTTQTTAFNNIIIENNVLDRGEGQTVLGLWLEGGKAGFTNVNISGNAILNTGNQGIMLTGVSGGTISHNVLLETDGVASKSNPAILLQAKVQNIDVANNVTLSASDAANGATGNTIHDNMLVQNTNQLQAGYYDASLDIKVAGLTDAASIYNTVVANVSETSATVNGVAVPLQVQVSSTQVNLDQSGTTFSQTLIGDSRANSLMGGSGNDTLDGHGGADTLAGGAGDDTYIVPNSQATIVEKPGGGIDTVIASGDYTLGANLENLTLSTGTNGWSATGNKLNNVIIGNAGANKLYGGAGDDTLDGGAGNDTLTGGTGADQFNFGQGGGVDHVTDFSVSEGDHMQLAAGSAYTVTQVGADTVINLGSGDQIILNGVNASSLGANSISVAGDQTPAPPAPDDSGAAQPVILMPVLEIMIPSNMSIFAGGFQL